jgi:hypothetical protein
VNSDPGLRIESFALINLLGVSTNKKYYVLSPCKPTKNLLQCNLLHSLTSSFYQNRLEFHCHYPWVNAMKFNFELIQNVHPTRLLDEIGTMWTGFNMQINVMCQYTLSIITSQLYCFQLRTTLNGKDFKLFTHEWAMHREAEHPSSTHAWKIILYFDQ